MSAARLTADSKAAGRAWRQPPPDPQQSWGSQEGLTSPRRRAVTTHFSS